MLGISACFTSCRALVSSCHDFLPVVKNLCLQITHLVDEEIFVLRAVIIVKRILEPKVTSVIPKAYQNISSEIFFHIILANFKIAVQENAVLDFTQFVKISDNWNSVIMSSHHQIVLMCFILCVAIKFFPFLNLTMQRCGNKKPCATFGCTGYKIFYNYLIDSELRFK